MRPAGTQPASLMGGEEGEEVEGVGWRADLSPQQQQQRPSSSPAAAAGRSPAGPLLAGATRRRGRPPLRWLGRPFLASKQQQQQQQQQQQHPQQQQQQQHLAAPAPSSPSSSPSSSRSSSPSPSHSSAYSSSPPPNPPPNPSPNPHRMKPARRCLSYKHQPNALKQLKKLDPRRDVLYAFYKGHWQRRGPNQPTVWRFRLGDLVRYALAVCPPGASYTDVLPNRKGGTPVRLLYTPQPEESAAMAAAAAGGSGGGRECVVLMPRQWFQLAGGGRARTIRWQVKVEVALLPREEQQQNQGAVKEEDGMRWVPYSHWRGCQPNWQLPGARRQQQQQQRG
ncbi:hypothetical protein Agub_g2747, partial [Astrephomene gubernaculifera]